MSSGMSRSMVFIDGSGDRYLPGTTVVRTWLRSERTGHLVEVSGVTLRSLAVEVDGVMVKPLTDPRDDRG